jgi:hypothetical protein
MKVTSHLVVSAGLLAGCASVKTPNDPGVVCTAIAVSSLNVTVRDIATGASVCDAKVTAIQSGTTHALRETGDCRYAGPYEQDGIFEVRAEKAGYIPASFVNVRVTKDECHVIPVQLTIDLPRQ